MVGFADQRPVSLPALMRVPTCPSTAGRRVSVAANTAATASMMPRAVPRNAGLGRSRIERQGRQHRQGAEGHGLAGRGQRLGDGRDHPGSVAGLHAPAFQGGPKPHDEEEGVVDAQGQREHQGEVEGPDRHGRHLGGQHQGAGGHHQADEGEHEQQDRQQPGCRMRATRMRSVTGHDSSSERNMARRSTALKSAQQALSPVSLTEMPGRNRSWSGRARASAARTMALGSPAAPAVIIPCPAVGGERRRRAVGGPRPSTRGSARSSEAAVATHGLSSAIGGDGHAFVDDDDLQAGRAQASKLSLNYLAGLDRLAGRVPASRSPGEGMLDLGGEGAEERQHRRPGDQHEPKVGWRSTPTSRARYATGGWTAAPPPGRCGLRGAVVRAAPSGSLGFGRIVIATVGCGSGHDTWSSSGLQLIGPRSSPCGRIAVLPVGRRPGVIWYDRSYYDQ